MPFKNIIKNLFQDIKNYRSKWKKNIFSAILVLEMFKVQKLNQNYLTMFKNMLLNNLQEMKYNRRKK